MSPFPYTDTIVLQRKKDRLKSFQFSKFLIDFKGRRTNRAEVVKLIKLWQSQLWTDFFMIFI